MSTSSTMRESRSLMDFASQSNPEDLAWAHATIPPSRVAAHVVDHTAQTAKAENQHYSDTAYRVLRYGIEDTANILATVEDHDLDLEHKLTVARDPRTISSIAAVALLHEDSMRSKIAAYPGGNRRLKLSYDKSHITYLDKLPETNRGCPYSGSTPFVQFVGWAGTFAITHRHLYLANR